MVSYFLRYTRGERDQVWSALCAFDVVPDDIPEDVEAVAVQTMRRVAAHVRRLADALPALGLVPVAPLHRPAGAEELADLPRLAEEFGGLPVALTACLREVGAVSFIGDCEPLGLSYHEGEPEDGPLPDPLVLPGADYLRHEWDDIRRDRPDPFTFGFAPDEMTKANIGGVAGRDGVTLVEYLRLSVAWGGLPGWADAPGDAPTALAVLRVVPHF